jgi:polyisoprenyl-phosphate glycosyltransferase
MISVVVPVYGCKTCLIELYFRLKKTFNSLPVDFELILVNDASPDDAWETIRELSARDNRVRGINFSRNFGQHYAIAAGIEHACGEWCVVMDCDLQDQPEEITKLYSKAQEGWDIVLGRRIDRKDHFFKRSFSKLFYRFLGYLTETQQDSSIANFGIYHRKVISAISSMGDYMRYFPTMVSWVGFKSTRINIEHAARTSGETSYSFRKLVKLALEVVLAFSDKPLRLTVKFGLLVSFSSLVFGCYNFYRYFANKIVVLGWATTVISIWFLSGAIIFLIGITGLYIGKIFDKVKQRPLYIVSEKTNFDTKDADTQ